MNTIKTRTTFVTYFKDIAENYVELENKTKSLSSDFFNKTKVFYSNNSDLSVKELVLEFKKSMLDAEEHVRDLLRDKGYSGSLSSECPYWRVVKSTTIKGLTLGLNPNNYKNISQFTKEIKNKNFKPISVNETENKVTNIVKKETSISNAIDNKLKQTLKMLKNLDEATAMRIMINFNKACYSALNGRGGRLINLKTGSS